MKLCWFGHIYGYIIHIEGTVYDIYTSDYRFNCCLISILSFNPLNRRSSHSVKGGEKVRSTVKNWATLAWHILKNAGRRKYASGFWTKSRQKNRRERKLCDGILTILKGMYNTHQLYIDREYSSNFCCKSCRRDSWVELSVSSCKRFQFVQCYTGFKRKYDEIIEWSWNRR